MLPVEIQAHVSVFECWRAPTLLTQTCCVAVTNDAVQVLDLSSNEFSAEGVGVIADATVNAAGLKQLRLLGNKIPFGLETLRKLMQVRQDVDWGPGCGACGFLFGCLVGCVCRMAQRGGWASTWVWW
jgi:hypothetical protein